MFPFPSRWRWHLSHPVLHLVQATQKHLDKLQEPYRETAMARARVLPAVLRVRFALLLLLSPAILATILSAFARALPAFSELVDFLNSLLSIAAALAVVVAMLFLLVNRYMGQLEKDLIACLALGAVTVRKPAKKATKHKP